LGVVAGACDFPGYAGGSSSEAGLEQKYEILLKKKNTKQGWWSGSSDLPSKHDVLGSNSITTKTKQNKTKQNTRRKYLNFLSTFIAV
jgi:hypothetical protein